MNKLKAGLVAALGLAIGFVTVRVVRKRRSNPQSEASDVGQNARAEADTAAEHARAAVAHVRAAGENTVEYARQEIVPAELMAHNGETETSIPQPVRRLRRVGKGWIRR